MEDHFDEMMAPADRSKKRKRAGESDGESDEDDGMQFGPAMPGEEGGADSEEDEEARIQKLLAEADKAEVDTLDIQGLKMMLLSFEKKINKNQLMRVKFADSPEKYMESEIELSEELQRLHVIAAAPELYPQLVAADAVTSMLGLLTHENTDISIESIALLNELTDPETLTETEEALCIVDALIENQALELLVQNLSRLDENEEEDAKGVYNTMGIIENLTEVKPDISVTLCDHTDILKWLLTRVKVRKFDGNKLYCSEILSIILSADTSNARKLGTLQGMDGIDMLLQVISHYRRRDPQAVEEEECVENLFSCLCTAMLIPENQTRFRHSEGFELMLRCMKERKYARALAFKVVDYAVQHSLSNCERFVDSGGLKTLFPGFMGQNYRRADKKGRDGGKKDKGKKKHLQLDFAEGEELEEHIISILCSLISHTVLEPGKPAWKRLVCKFVEDDLAKVGH
jgi:beta-catenin-like protein 1